MAEDLGQSGVRVVQDGPVLRVTLARPQRRNTQGPRLWQALAELGESLASDVEVVVLDALGPSFSAGLDRQLLAPGPTADEPSLAVLAALDDDALDATIASYQRAFTWWHEADVVSVAVVGGHAIGAGFQLALGCDLRVASTDAVFALAEARLGLVPDLGGTKRLVDLVGASRALDLAASGRTIDADEAYRIGVVDRLVGPDALAAVRDSVVSELLEADPRARLAAKRLIHGASGRTLAEQRAAERRAQIPLLRRLLSRSPSA